MTTERARVSILAVVASAAFASACQGHDKPDQPIPPDPPRCGAASVDLDALPAPEAVWLHVTPDMVFFSPRPQDLDGDGQPEILVSGGRESPPAGQMLAVDGRTGDLFWKIPARQELYNSPTFLDVTGDGVKDVFVGGRNKELLGIDGATGSLLWQFPHEGVEAPDGWYNFYTAVVIDDQTGDGVPDLLLANGGSDAIREPGAPRPAGRLLVVDSVRGAPVAFAENPDHEETYMSPLVLPTPGTGSPTILFGTGGETRGGALWKTTLADVMAGDLTGAKRLVSIEGKGVIAPPALSDLNRDGRVDIIVATFDGQLIAFDGATDDRLWQIAFEGFESYSTPTLGFFDSDRVPDVFAVFLHGQFPDYVAARRVLVNGRDGTIVWQEDDGDFSMSGDVAVDLNGDGIDEVIFSTNDTSAPDDRQHQLYLLDTAGRKARAWGAPLGATALGSPWVGDVDLDGCLDLVVPGAAKQGTMAAAVLTRFRVAAPVPRAISWSGYLGTDFDSRLR